MDWKAAAQEKLLEINAQIGELNAQIRELKVERKQFELFAGTGSKRANVVTRILQALPATQSELCESTGAASSTLTVTLGKMRKDGKVHKDGDVWRKTSETEPAPENNDFFAEVKAAKKKK